MSELLIRQEGFSGKRPFGNSDWYYCLCVTFLLAEVIDGEFTNYGDESAGDDYEIHHYDDQAADEKLLELVDHIFKHGANIED